MRSVQRCGRGLSGRATRTLVSADRRIVTVVPRTGELLWQPAHDARRTTRLGRFMDRVEVQHGLELPSYDALWHWSVADLRTFWGAVTEEFDVRFHTPGEEVLRGTDMPQVEWFPGARLNFMEPVLGHLGRPGDAIVAYSQTRDVQRWSWSQLLAEVGRIRAGLVRLGIERGDRVVAYLPNVPEAVAAFLACASLGAIWSSCAPEFGIQAVLDRVQQIRPRVLLAVDGYRYGDRTIDRRADVEEIRRSLPSLEYTVILPYLEPDRAPAHQAMPWSELTRASAAPGADALPFDHPLYVLYSSGTTGVPKAIVHGHGGILLEHLKVLGLQSDLREDDVLLWFTTTGWMMWNRLVSALLLGTTIVLFDGSPTHPGPQALWDLVHAESVTVLGVGAPLIMAWTRAGIDPGDRTSSLRQLASTAAPLPLVGYGWVYEHCDRSLQLVSASGGTDVCTALVGGAPLLPVYAGEISGPCLGVGVASYDDKGRPVVGSRGEMAVTTPMPSMPVGLWGDDDGSRYRRAYFDRFPGVWAHGDWLEITPRATYRITGRSDATLNRGGVRMGTAEFYACVDTLPGIADSLVVHLEDEDGPGRLVLFVQLESGITLDRQRLAIDRACRQQLSPRHVPDLIVAVPAIPRTLSGKRLEVPVKRLLLGEDPGDTVSTGVLRTPTSVATLLAAAEQAGLTRPERTHHPR